jgi:GT2 family glycosyltransferase/antitoxin (DNA-binding transcriptional repressor) of toxin-antitoxin stability system
MAKGGARGGKPGKAGGGADPRGRLCFIDRIDEAGVGGWAVDFDALTASLKLRVLVDGVIEDVITCDLHREDARLINLHNDRIGFYYNIPDRYRDGLRHLLTFATLDGEAMALSSRNGAMAALNFCLNKPVRVEAVLDGMIDGLIQGWVLRVDERAGTRTGGAKILVTVDGQPVAELVADQYRADVAAEVACDAACGFYYAPPPELQRRRRASFRFFTLPDRQELKGSPLEIIYPDEAGRENIEQMMERANELFAFAYKLRKDLQAVLPRARYMLADYQRWAAVSGPLALPRAIARYGALPCPAPLVSIICPVYRPEIGAFLAMVDSVRAQSYAHWELVLVDDASRDERLSQVMAELARAEPRIRLVARRKNGGIARASNDGLAAAAGALVAFLDHDDMLAPEALEIMVRAQGATGARLLYSDEDKIERGGARGEPHFKPDFNYRLLLELNYICHFVMVEAGLARAAGGFDAAFDGAQDHDFLLRLVERVAPGEIHHVPEILYHWRKSGVSTAAAGAAAKPRAVSAGEALVAAHLARRGLAAEVTARQGVTCYDVRWRVEAKRRKGHKVSILIPFRDHIEMTAACVAAVRRWTRDVAYEIILLDNWSTSGEAERFCAAQANLENTKVIRIAEPFNYSRINNIGARAAEGEFLLLMNNDVFVGDEGWLARLVDEALADERVGAVGAKLLYPNGTVQHAGVVLGVGGVADHAFRAIAGDAPGYMMHAWTAQEVSAVTGACMLVRKAAFEAVGGLDEAELTIAFNDIDLCVKLREAGWKIMFAPECVAEHRESMSRGDDFDDAKIARFMLENEVMRSRYPAVLAHDPFYSPHFSREGGVYRELRVVRPGEL